MTTTWSPSTLFCSLWLTVWPPLRGLLFVIGLCTTDLLDRAYGWTTVPRFYLRVTVLTVIAVVTGRTFVVRLPNHPPRFIARWGSTVLRVFPLTHKDIDHIYEGAGTYLRAYKERKWRSDMRVRQLLTEPNQHGQLPPPCEIDLRRYRLSGPRVVQGLGLVGQGVHLAVMEELGRWPGERGQIAVRLFDWKQGRPVLGRLPLSFVSGVNVEEICEVGEAQVTIKWEDMERGGARMKLGVYMDVSDATSSIALPSLASSDALAVVPTPEIEPPARSTTPPQQDTAE